MKRAGPWLLLLFVAALLFGAPALREAIGIEGTPESVRARVAALGWKGPALYVALVTFRTFVMLPSMILLSAGGLAFGFTLGTALGAVGVVASALYKFGIARWIGREYIRPRLGAAILPFERRVETAGPFVVGLATAHPLGPMGPFHWAAGFATVPALGFVLAVVLAGPVRAAAFSVFGATLLDWGSPRFYAASAALLLVAVAPLVHPAFRRWLFGREETPPQG